MHNLFLQQRCVTTISILHAQVKDLHLLCFAVAGVEAEIVTASGCSIGKVVFIPPHQLQPNRYNTSVRVQAQASSTEASLRHDHQQSTGADLAYGRPLFAYSSLLSCSIVCGQD